MTAALLARPSSPPKAADDPRRFEGAAALTRLGPLPPLTVVRPVRVPESSLLRHRADPLNPPPPLPFGVWRWGGARWENHLSNKGRTVLEEYQRRWPKAFPLLSIPGVKVRTWNGQFVTGATVRRFCMFHHSVAEVETTLWYGIAKGVASYDPGRVKGDVDWDWLRTDPAAAVRTHTINTALWYCYNDLVAPIVRAREAGREEEWEVTNTVSGLPGEATKFQIPDHRGAGYEETVDVRERAALLLDLVPKGTRERRCLVGYYGLDGNPPMSYRDLGAELGVSHERIRQLVARALRWIRTG